MSILQFQNSNITFCSRNARDIPLNKIVIFFLFCLQGNETLILCAIPGFRRGTNEIVALLKCYAL